MKIPWPYILAFALVFYGNGAAFIESFVNYPSWSLIGAAEFARYHQFIAPRIIAFLVAPALLGTAFTVAMLKYRPAAIPLWSVWAAVALQLVVWVSTAAIQIPMQIELGSKGFSDDRLAYLIASNFWLRRIPYALTAAIFLWMARKIVTSARRDESGSVRR